MSDSDEAQYWRIMKRNGEGNIKDGDEVRLCWSFADQTTGYRDFTEDVFGRRRMGAPPGAGLESGVLYPKLPWPRFEKLSEQASEIPDAQKKKPGMNSLLMSTISSEETALVALPCRQSVAARVSGAGYAVQDLSFRIDMVANEGRGDGDDYLLRGIRQAVEMSTEEKERAAYGVLLQQARQKQDLFYKMLFL